MEAWSRSDALSSLSLRGKSRRQSCSNTTQGLEESSLTTRPHSCDERGRGDGKEAAGVCEESERWPPPCGR